MGVVGQPQFSVKQDNYWLSHWTADDCLIFLKIKIFYKKVKKVMW